MAGEIDVDGMLRHLTAKQFFGWQAYYELEPSEDVKADYRAASIVQILYNVNRGKNERPIKLHECLVKFKEAEAALAERPKRKQTQQEQVAILKMLAAAYENDVGPPSVIEDKPPVVGDISSVEEPKAE
jgi:hypothetical protein